MRPKRFLILTVVFCAGLFLLHRPSPSTDIYGAIPQGKVVSLAPITVGEMMASKLEHARLNPKYAIGLFGNSRSVMVSARDIGLGGRSFFNFSVPSSSIRTSIYMVEQLGRLGKLPKIVVISFDHLELEFFGNPSVRGFGERIRLLAFDLREGMANPSISVKSTVRMTWRHVYGGVKDGMRYFNFRQLLIGARWRFGTSTRPSRGWREARSGNHFGYRRDGSYKARNSRRRRKLRVRPRAPSIIAGYLARDLHRLARSASGATVIIYESPLHPVNLSRFRDKPTPHARAIRRLLLARCMELRIECAPFPEALPDDDGSMWRDGSHAPARQLGRYLNGLIVAAVGKRKARGGQ